MNKQEYTIINDIKCYNLEDSNDYANYPDEGFDMSKELEKSSFWCMSRCRLLKNIIDKYSSQFDKVRFLEIGCGIGTLINELIPNKKLVITASDIYLKGIIYAKQKALNEASNVEFIQFNVEKGTLPVKFDIIGAFDVLEHIDNDDLSISNIYNMLNEGGYFLLTVPQYMFLWSNLDYIVKHKRRYSRKELLCKLTKQGFNVYFSTSFIFILFPLMLISRLIDKLKSNPNISSNELASKVIFSKLLNWFFDIIMRIDEFLIQKGFSLPFGGTLLVVAHK
jgi:2-polyprenyl-3-methyl-5-hydroxy-6-metoxy-1,4-benzoquinol methylase